MRSRSIRTAIAGTLIAGLALGMGGCASTSAGGVTTLDFFQFKGEALEDFNEMIAAFEAENPDIKVVQNQVGDSETLIRTLLVKDRTPDVITLNGNGNFGKLADAVRYAISQRPFIERCFTEGRFEIDHGEIERILEKPCVERSVRDLNRPLVSLRGVSLQRDCAISPRVCDLSRASDQRRSGEAARRTNLEAISTARTGT